MCSYTPRFSYGCPKYAVPSGVPVPSRVVHAGVRVLGGYLGRVYGWVYGRAIPGTQRQGRPTTKRRQSQRSGPRKPLPGAGVGGDCCSAPGRPHPPLRGPVWSLQDPPWCSSSKPRLWAYRARLRSIFSKVKQNGEVSPNNVQKACHSPYSPKRGPKVTS